MAKFSGNPIIPFVQFRVYDDRPADSCSICQTQEIGKLPACSKIFFTKRGCIDIVFHFDRNTKFFL